MSIIIKLNAFLIMRSKQRNLIWLQQYILDLMILNTFTQDKKQITKSSQCNNQYFNLLNDKGTCEYQNFTSVEKINEDNITPNQIKVSNKLCKQNGQFMEKVTVIKFNNQVITIKDRYRFLSESNPSSESILQKRIHIFKKPLHSQGKNQGKRRVTKNLPKNFIKAFLNYLQSIKDQQNQQLLQCKMRLLTSRQKYNNSFIQRIIDDPNLQQYFSNFLNNHARQWIQNSKIRDKDVHYQAIEIFKKLRASRTDRKQENFHQIDSYLQQFSESSQQLSEMDKESNKSDKESIIANSSKHQDDQQIQQ